MPLTNLGHFLIRTDDLEKTKTFYEKFLGMTDGYRPPFPFPGHWLYIGGTAIVHMANFRAGVDEKYYSDQRVGDTSSSTGPFDHIAFNATGPDEFVRRFENAGIEMSRRTVPEDGTHQIFVTDPNGIVVELDFPAEEAKDFTG
jgi:catechol 2,3-dioxygenase-like lactoylglutathione lyase family enzyme